MEIPDYDFDEALADLLAEDEFDDRLFPALPRNTDVRYTDALRLIDLATANAVTVLGDSARQWVLRHRVGPTGRVIVFEVDPVPHFGYCRLTRLWAFGSEVGTPTFVLTAETGSAHDWRTAECLVRNLLRLFGETGLEQTAYLWGLDADVLGQRIYVDLRTAEGADAGDPGPMTREWHLMRYDLTAAELRRQQGVLADLGSRALERGIVVY